MKKLTPGGERALLTVSLQEAYHVYFPKSGSPGPMAGLLQAVRPKGDLKHWTAGQAAADIIAACSPAVRCQLVSHPSSAYGRCDLAYVYKLDPWNPRVYAHAVLGGELQPAMFAEGAGQFYGWAEGLTGLEAAVGKVVRFAYEGGSRPGEVRTVRCEKVSRTAAGGLRLDGLDLSVQDLDQAHRQYDCAKIQGEVEVLN